MGQVTLDSAALLFSLVNNVGLGQTVHDSR